MGRPRNERRAIELAPNPRDFLKDQQGRSLRPEARLPYKHALNPPIVTIFGAGVGGLTVAHELVERGFIVQVLEAAEDPFNPGRPLVGGMAANQPARVRANVEDVHPELISLALDYANGSANKVARWLVELFTFNRSRWLSTEEPSRFHQILYSDPETFGQPMVDALLAAREQYRERWLWDLVCRGAQLGFLRFKKRRKPLPPAQQLEAALAEHKKLVKSTNDQLALALLNALLDASPDAAEHLPSRADLEKQVKALVIPAFEREFLYFRLVPYAVTGVADASSIADTRLEEWSQFLNDALGASLAKDPGDTQFVARGTGSARLPGEPDGWLKIDVIEQRLPGEHGYRFFPSFYRHLDDTMKRIPIIDGGQDGQRTVFDNLRPTVFQGIAFTRDQQRARGVKVPWDDAEPALYPQKRRARPGSGKGPAEPPIVVEIARERPRGWEGLRDSSDRFVRRLGGTQRDALLLFAKLLRYMTSSSERRRAKYEDESWQDFIDVGKFSKPMQAQIKSAAQALLAFSVDEVDARTYGNIALQMLFDQLKDGTRVDRTLNGPTSDAWLEPWREYLESQGVRFFCLKLDALEPRGSELVPKIVRLNGEPIDAKVTYAQNSYQLLTHENPHSALQPDFYVLALSLERTAELLEPLKRDARRAHDFAAIPKFHDEAVKHDAMKDMTGIQFFFDAKTSIGKGHMYFPYSDWGLSSISQSEFWLTRGRFADGYAGVLSVDICDAKYSDKPKPGSFWSVVKLGESGDLTGAENLGYRRLGVARTVWNQLTELIGPHDRMAEPRCFHLDRAITEEGNATKFLGSVKGLDEHRPGRTPRVDAVGDAEIAYSINATRWVVCGTFMATHTRMTTMEAANESARHAVRAILDRLGEDDSEKPATAVLEEGRLQIENLRNKTYNGASSYRPYDPPDIWDPEQEEHEDLDFMKRVDCRLMGLELGHFLDILDFDRKLEHALDAMELYGGEQPMREFLGSMVATLDASLVKELGVGYDQDIGERYKQARDSVGKLGGALPGPLFDDMKGLLTRVGKLMDLFKV